ncbi:MAG: tRNA guanosine(34) transglycosylase Tgt [Spirulinaceae cyanobacterium SM2_1_0]|nr:tRNA guanosine(34) transglycosylase Tgt [Spirulinaceae cyanobacterium SM2_1_0]
MCSSTTIIPSSTPDTIAGNAAFSLQFQAHCSTTQARAATFYTPHGAVETPRFMPVGTLATIKGLTPAQLAQAGAQMVLANTYHLHLQPGEDLVAAAGGLHQFMAWPQPILTDSGGFQVFSLSDLRQIDETGVTFRSPRDGRLIAFSPERSIAIQNALGADVIMAFDECPPYPATRAAVAAATERTYRWLERCIAAHQHPREQALFGIVQGGVYAELRVTAAQAIAQFDLPGYAIGGVSVGEPPALMRAIVAKTAPLLPASKPRYLMGVGTYREIAQAIAAGVDLFDCVLPTRLGRHGTALVDGERWNLKNARFRADLQPLAADCPCYTCQHFSRAYLSHLVRARELLAHVLLSLHNVTELIRFTQRIRAAIVGDRFTSEFAAWLTETASDSGLEA